MIVAAAIGRIEIVMCVHLALRLVLDEEHRVHGLAHIMEHRARRA